MINVHAFFRRQTKIISYHIFQRNLSIICICEHTVVIREIAHITLLFKKILHNLYKTENFKHDLL